MSVLGKLFDSNKREVKSLSKLADKVLKKDEEYANLSDEELKNKTIEFRKSTHRGKKKGKYRDKTGLVSLFLFLPKIWVCIF